LSYKNFLIKNFGKYYDAIIENKIYKIKISFLESDNRYKVVKIFPASSSNKTDSLITDIEENTFVIIIQDHFEKDFKFKSKQYDSSGNETTITLVDTLNLYKLANNFYNQIQGDKQSIEEKKI